MDLMAAAAHQYLSAWRALDQQNKVIEYENWVFDGWPDPSPLQTASNAALNRRLANFPAITDLAMATEIYLKALYRLEGLENPVGHNHKELFDDLPARPRAHVMQLLLSSGTVDTEQKALDRIEANSDAFVTFRYIYEKLPAEGEDGRLIHWTNFAIGFAECLRRALEELQIVDRRANL